MIYSDHYMLKREEIEEILKKGKFDEKKYSDNLLCHAVTVKEVLDRYFDDDETKKYN